MPTAASVHGVSPGTIAQVRGVVDDAELTELALTASLWNSLPRLHRVLDLPAPPPGLDARL